VAYKTKKEHYCTSLLRGEPFDLLQTAKQQQVPPVQLIVQFLALRKAEEFKIADLANHFHVTPATLRPILGTAEIRGVSIQTANGREADSIRFGLTPTELILLTSFEAGLSEKRAINEEMLLDTLKISLNFLRKKLTGLAEKGLIQQLDSASGTNGRPAAWAYTATGREIADFIGRPLN
jgi:hypothetical protein